MRILLHVRRNRLGHRRTSARQAGRHNPGPCRALQYNRHEYTNNPLVNRTQPLDGTYYLVADGTPDMPIVIKGAGDGEVIFDGNGNFAMFDVRAADYTYFEGVTIRNAEYGILAARSFCLGSKGLTVKRTRFEQVGSGIFTNYSGSSNFYIADSTFIGRNYPDHVIGWSGEFWAPFNGVAGQKFPPPMASYVAIKLYGPDMSWRTTTSRTSMTASTSRSTETLTVRPPARPEVPAKGGTSTDGRFRSTSITTT